jgi:hypothetical protein
MVGRAFYYFHPAYPKESIRLDPLHSFSRASELASRLAALIPSETGSDPFKAFSQKSLDNIVQAILTLDSRPTILKLRRYLESGRAEWFRRRRFSRPAVNWHLLQEEGHHLLRKV